MLYIESADNGPLASGPLSDWCHLISCTAESDSDSPSVGVTVHAPHPACLVPVAFSAAVVQTDQKLHRSRTALHYFWFLFHQSTSSPSCKTPLNPTAHPVLPLKRFPLLILRFHSCLFTVIPPVDTSSQLVTVSPPTCPVWLCVTDHHLFSPLRRFPQKRGKALMAAVIRAGDCGMHRHGLSRAECDKEPKAWGHSNIRKPGKNRW